VELHSLPSFDPTSANPVQQVDLNYELTDHLGNVCAVVTGRLLDGNGGGTPKQAELVSAQGYEAFGSLLPGRNYSSGSYRFGLNGQEKDDEIYGATGTSYTAEFWQYDPRTARRWNLDPVPQVSISDYAAFALNPIFNTDPLGNKVRGSREGMRMWREQRRDLTRRMGALAGRTDVAALTLMTNYSLQLNTMQQMRQSTVLFHLSTGPENLMAVDESRRLKKGRVEMMVRADECASSNLAEQVTEAGLFMNSGWSFASKYNVAGDHLSAPLGGISDIVDYRSMNTAGESMSIDVNSSTLSQDVNDMQTYVNQLVQIAGPQIFRGAALQQQLSLSTPINDGDLPSQGVDPTVPGQQPCTTWGCQVGGANGRARQEWRMEGGEFKGPSKKEMRSVRR
jgi:hypothetical protein